MSSSQPRGTCQPASQPEYTRPAIDAITQAASTEHDFPGWLADVLANAAARLASGGVRCRSAPATRSPHDDPGPGKPAWSTSSSREQSDTTMSSCLATPDNHNAQTTNRPGNSRSETLDDP